MINFTLLVYSG